MKSSSRRTRCGAIVLVGLVASVLAACGSSDTSPTASTPLASTSSSSGPAPAAGKDHASGLVATVSGNTITLNGSAGAHVVVVSPSTHVVETTPGRLTDVAVGDCVVVRPTRDGGAPPTVTAASVQFGAAHDGRCGHASGGKAVTGTVASVTGNTVAVTEAAQSANVTVTVTPATRYATRAKASTTAIAVGQCLTARGTTDDSGNLDAQNVGVRPSDAGQCSQGKSRAADARP